MSTFDELFGVEFWQIAMIEQLLETSVLKNENININSLDYNSANDLIKKLQQTQIDPIDSGLNYSMGDIKRKLNKYL